MKKIEKKDIWLFMLINLGLILGLNSQFFMVISLFRLTHLDDGVGGDAEGGIDFTATDANGEPIGGRITFADDTATLTFIHSSWSLIEEGAKWEFKRK